jgi:hypothetical protein
LAHQVEPLQVGDLGERGEPDRQIREANGYVLTSADAIGDKGVATGVRVEIENGKRLLAFGTTMAAQSPELVGTRLDLYRPMAEFLRANFGLGALPYKLISPNHERDFKLSTNDQFFFRDTQFAAGVSGVTVNAPYLATYNDYSIPLLVCPDKTLAVDSHDQFVGIGHRTKACAVTWPVGDERASPRVILFTGVVFTEDLAGAPTTHPTHRFAENIVEWLAGNPTELQAKGTEQNTVSSLHSIELGIHEVVRTVLADKRGDNWRRDCIPEPVRAEAAALRERLREDGPLENYLYLVDLKEIILRNWSDFQMLFGVPTMSKEACMSWLQRFNEIRNRASHPVRLREHPMTEDELSFLKERAQFVAAILVKARGPEKRPGLM